MNQRSLWELKKKELILIILNLRKKIDVQSNTKRKVQREKNRSEYSK